MAENPMHPSMEAVTKPTPDPTVLTTEALQREVSALEAAAKDRAQWFERELALRQNAREREVQELRDRLERTRISDRALIDAELRILDEKFKGQDRILNLIEEQRKERKEDDRRALDAALAAAEKARVADTEASDRANTKTELSTAEQLKQQNATSSQANAGTVALLNTLQTRVERIENIKQNTQEVTTERRASSSQAWMVVAGVVGVLGLIFAIAGFAAAFYFAAQR